MRKIMLMCFASILAAGMTQAALAHCNGFEIKIKNNLPEDFVVSKIQFQGADIQPNTIQILNSRTEQAFVVNNSVNGIEMTGNFEFHTISIPSKKVSIVFNLKDRTLICSHDDKGSGGDYPVSKRRLPGNVTYTIG